MTRGVKNTRFDHISLCRGDVRVHPAAESAYWFYRRFQVPSRMRAARGTTSTPIVPPILHAQKAGRRYLLVSDFTTLQFLSDAGKTECLYRPAENLTHKQICSLAWRSVFSIELLQKSSPELLVAKYLVLRDNLPDELIQELLPSDPTTGKPPKMTVSSFARACGSSASTFNNFLPRLRNGGVADVLIEDVFETKEKSSDE